MKICPKCELNYINDDEELCDVCDSTKVKAEEKPITYLERGHLYGTNAFNIYKRCCGFNGMGWPIDIAKSCFGSQRKLYGEINYDTAVWFWTHCINTTGTTKDDDSIENRIEPGTDKTVIVSKYDTLLNLRNFNQTRVPKRIVFCKNRSGIFEFLGVFERCKDINETEFEETYKLIQENYSM